MKGVLQKYEVPRQLESLLEFIDKLLSPDLIPVQQDQITHFSNSYGEVSFLLISQDDNSDLVKCVLEIANENKPYIYFSQLFLHTYTTKSGLNLISPAIMVFYSLLRHLGLMRTSCLPSKLMIRPNAMK
jgi:hypothetical protein